MIVDVPDAPTRAARARIEHEIDRLIELLDEIDGDLDLEPSLGWPEAGPDELPTDFSHDDREEEDEHGGDVADEPHDPEDDENDNSNLDWPPAGRAVVGTDRSAYPARSLE